MHRGYLYKDEEKLIYKTLEHFGVAVILCRNKLSSSFLFKGVVQLCA